MGLREGLGSRVGWPELPEPVKESLTGGMKAATLPGNSTLGMSKHGRISSQEFAALIALLGSVLLRGWQESSLL